MLTEIFLAILQAVTEFLPISSSGHLALFSNLISKPNIYFFTVLHLASLFAVLIFTRKEIVDILSFKKEDRKFLGFLILATIPAGLAGYFLRGYIERSLSSYLFLGIAFIFTGGILILTKFAKGKRGLDSQSAFFVGLMQVLALFPGVSRSGMTISASLFSGIEKEKAAKFSFLLFIPLVFGAMILETGKFYFSWSLVASFFVCLVLSVLFLDILLKVIKKGYFWIFGFYCFAIGIFSLVLSFS